MRNGHLGYLNKVLWSDIRSYEVFEQDSKLYAVEVEKVPTKEAVTARGGFVRTCLNNDELFDDSARIVECGKEFEVFERKCGFYSKSYDVVMALSVASYIGGKDALEAYAQEQNLAVVYDNKCETAYLVNKTKSGKLKVKYSLLSEKIDEKCRYFYDLNF